MAVRRSNTLTKSNSPPFSGICALSISPVWQLHFMILAYFKVTSLFLPFHSVDDICTCICLCVACVLLIAWFSRTICVSLTGFNFTRRFNFRLLNQHERLLRWQWWSYPAIICHRYVCVCVYNITMAATATVAATIVIQIHCKWNHSPELSNNLNFVCSEYCFTLARLVAQFTGLTHTHIFVCVCMRSTYHYFWKITTILKSVTVCHTY